MIISIDRYVDFLVKKNLTEHQFLVCYLIYTKEIKAIVKYNNKFKISREELLDLIDRDFIIPIFDDPEHIFDLANLNVTPKFYEGLIIDEDNAEEIWDLYPSYLLINNTKVYSKSSMPKEDFIKMYLRITRRSQKTHERIKKVLEEYNRKNKYAEMGIDKFIGSEYWKELEKQKNAGTPGIRFE